jgi:hypothetical protein
LAFEKTNQKYRPTDDQIREKKSQMSADFSLFSTCMLSLVLIPLFFNVAYVINLEMCQDCDMKTVIEYIQYKYDVDLGMGDDFI